METVDLWLISVLASTVFAGLSNFAFKIAAKRNYDAALFSLLGTALLFVLSLGEFCGVGDCVFDAGCGCCLRK